MIPRTVHYFWFGRGDKPELVRKCIGSWKVYLPDYELKEWNEDNFDVDAIPYTKDAYAAGAYAFVSDYARFKVLHEHGGLYFDTDVELIRPLDGIVSAGPFFAMESDGNRSPLAVNPGLGLGAEPGMELYGEILERFAGMSFLAPDGSRNPYSMIPMVTELLAARGLKGNGGMVDGFMVYPPRCFNPFDDATGRLRVAADTVAIHWYAKSWMQDEPLSAVQLKRLLRRVFGTGTVSRVGGLFKK